MIFAKCIVCGVPFAREADEYWKSRCLSCWRRSKDTSTFHHAPAAKVSGVDAELAEHLRGLLQLCHPDKHAGSELAQTTTQWLLKVRKELRV